MAALFLVAMVAVLLCLELAQRHRKRALAEPAAAAAQSRFHLVGHLKNLPVDSLPHGLFCDRGHTWFQVEPSGAIRLGADMFPSTLLGQVDDIKVRPAGTDLKQGEPIVTMGRAGRQITLCSPVEGTIQEVNSVAVSDRTRLKQDPFGNGWIYRIAPRKLGPALRETLVGEEAVQWMRRELERLRDFLSLAGNRNSLVSATLPDGGLPVEGIEEQLDDASWQALCHEFFHRWPLGGERK